MPHDVHTFSFPVSDFLKPSERKHCSLISQRIEAVWDYLRVRFGNDPRATARNPCSTTKTQTTLLHQPRRVRCGAWQQLSKVKRPEVGSGHLWR